MADSQDTSAICYYRKEGCKAQAVVHVFCKVEGRDTHFCSNHWASWSASARGDSLLAQHCPRCAPAYIARREAQAANTRITVADEPITGPLADAIDQAMHSAGILAPQRQEVLRRLAANTDAYVAAVMSRQSATVVLCQRAQRRASRRSRACRGSRLLASPSALSPGTAPTGAPKPQRTAKTAPSASLTRSSAPGFGRCRYAEG